MSDSSEMRENSVMQDQETCPHEHYGLDMKLVSDLVEQPNGKWKCKFCGAEFDSPQK